MINRIAARGWLRAVPLALILVLLAACGENSTATPNPTATSAPIATATPENTATVAPDTASTDTPDDITTPPTAQPTLDIPLPPSPTPLPTPAGVTQDQQVTMYGVVARDLLKQSEAATGGGVPTFIGISPQTGQGELLDTSSPGADIPDDLVGELADLGTTVAFTEFSQAIGDLSDGAQVRDNGVYLTFGTLTADPASGGYQVYASFYHASDDAAGYSYTLVQQQDSWQIKNRTEVWRQ